MTHVEVFSLFLFELNITQNHSIFLNHTCEAKHPHCQSWPWSQHPPHSFIPFLLILPDFPSLMKMKILTLSQNCQYPQTLLPFLEFRSSQEHRSLPLLPIQSNFHWNQAILHLPPKKNSHEPLVPLATHRIQELAGLFMIFYCLIFFIFA